MQISYTRAIGGIFVTAALFATFALTPMKMASASSVLTCEGVALTPGLNVSDVNGNWIWPGSGVGNATFSKGDRLWPNVNNKTGDSILLQVEFPVGTVIIKQTIPGQNAAGKTYTFPNTITDQPIIFRVSQIDGGQIDFGISTVCITNNAKK